MFTGLKLVRGSDSDVVIMPAHEDPLLTTGKFPLPRTVRDKFRAMEKAHVPLEMMYTYIAHEVPCNSVNPNGPIPLEVITPPLTSAVRTSECLGDVTHAITTSLLKGALAAITLPLAAVALPLFAAIALPLAAPTSLDPVIFGAIADERGMATWFILAQWTWE